MAANTVWRWCLDVLLAAVAAYAAVILTKEVIVGAPTIWATVVVSLAALYGAVLVFRRVAPVAVLAVQAVAAVGYVALGLPVFMLGFAVLVSLYTVASRRDWWTALVSLATAEVLLAVLLWWGPSFPGVPSWVLFAALLGGAWFLGDVVRRWQHAAAAHARRAAELERAREELARLAVTAERVRMARELHDVVAHSMSVIAMHAGSGRLAADRDPAATQEALEVIERSSRDALAEMRRLVTVLRDPAEGSPALAPMPGLADVHRLVAEVAATGMTVDVLTKGDLARVPDGVSLAAYRIVQEALTNVVRHAGPTHVRLSVMVDEDRVVVEVTDDGTSHAPGRPAPHDGGHGIAGMRERATLYGGELTAGPTAQGGWRVTGWLPLPAVDQ
jgi:signal transduction histidine kinase